MEFIEAVKKLQKGEKIRRPCFDEDEYLDLKNGTIPKFFDKNIDSWQYFPFDTMDYLADDWETFR